MTSAIYFLVSVTLIFSLFLIQIENSKLTPYEIKPPGGKGLGFQKILLGAFEHPTGIQIGFRTIRISSGLPSITLLGPDENVEALEGDVLLTITEKGLLKGRFPNFANHLLYINHGENRRIPNLQPPSKEKNEKTYLAAYQLKKSNEFCYLGADKNSSKTDLHKFFKNGNLTPKILELFDKTIPIQFVKVTVNHREESIPQLDLKLPLDGLLASQRWFRAIDRLQYEEIFQFNNGVLGWPYVFNFSGLSPTSTAFRWRLKSDTFGMLMGNNLVIISEKLSVEHSQDGSFELQRLQPYLMIVMHIPGKLIMSMDGAVPFSSAIYRKGKLNAKISSPGSIEIQIQENDMIVLWPWNMCRTGNSEWHDPLLKSTIYQNETLGLKNLATRLFKGREIVIKVSKCNKSTDIKVMPRPYMLRLPGKSTKHGLQFVKFEWYSVDLDYPTSFVFNENSVYLGEPFKVFPIQYLEKGTQTKDVKEIFNKENGHRLLLKLKDGKLIIQSISNLDEHDKKGLGYSVSLNRKGLKLPVEGFQGTSTTILNLIEEGDIIEIYDKDGGKMSPQTLPFSPAKDLKSPINETPHFYKTSVIALSLSIGKAEKPERKVDRANLVLNTIRSIHWLNVDEIGRVKMVNASFDKKNRNSYGWRFQWYQEGNQNLVWDVSYSLFGLQISDKSVVISSDKRKSSIIGKLDADHIATLAWDRHDSSMRISCDGIVPFTWALYREKTKVISWSGKGIYKFDDMESGDILVLIPWSTFSAGDKMESIKEITKDHNSFLAALSKGFSKMKFLAARIFYKKPEDDYIFEEPTEKLSKIQGLLENY